MDECDYALTANQASSHFCARLLSHEARRGLDGKLTTLVDDDMKELMTKLEQSPNKSSTSLGAAERFAETLGGLLRTHREDLRERLGVAVRADSLAFEWLVSYVTYL